MREWLRRHFLPELMLYLAIPVISGVLIAVWGMAQALPGPYLMAVVVLVIAGTLGILNQGREWLRVVQYRNDRKLDSTLREWLFRRGRSSEPIARGNDDIRFFCANPSAHQLKSLIAKPQGSGGIWVSAKIPVSNWDAVPMLKRWRALHDIRIEFLKFGISFSGVQDPLTEVVINTYVPINRAFTENAFIEAVNQVEKGIMMTHELLNRALMPTPEEAQADILESGKYRFGEHGGGVNLSMAPPE